MSPPVITETMIDSNTIASRLQQALGNPELKLKVKQNKHHLGILVERPPDMALDYESLTAWFIAAVRSMPGLQVDVLSLYSRPQGEKQPDWQIQTALTPEETAKSDLEDPEVQLEDRPEASESLDLSQYCFIRNPLLLRTSLPIPPSDIQQQILFFHQLPDAEKQRVLPVLIEFFKNSDTDRVNDLTEEQQHWFSQMRYVDEQKFKTISIWLSRYCADPEKALQESQPPPPPPSHDPPAPIPHSTPQGSDGFPSSQDRRARVLAMESESSNSQSSVVLSIVCHLSTYLLPLIVPLVIYFVAPDPISKGNARSCLGFYLGQLGYSILAVMLIFINGYLGGIIFVLLLVYTLVMPIVATIVCATNPGVVFKYPGMP